jgi:hypothetical protein
MNTLALIGWAVAVFLVCLGAAVLVVALAVAMRLWPSRAGEVVRQNRKRDRWLRHFRRVFGSRKHPKHPAVNDQALPQGGAKKGNDEH